MADGFSFDYAEFDRLAADIAEAPREARKGIRKAVEVTSRYVKDGWNTKLSGSEGLSQVAPTIDYEIKGDTVFGTSEITSEIGANRSDSSAKLANISEFGTTYHPPRGYGHAALQENIPDFEKGLGMAIGDIL